MRAYAAYQERYAGSLRESDRELIELVREHAKPGASLLDVGCSTGNLLLHLSHAIPGLELHGADMAAEIIAACKADERLAGIEFYEQDMLDLRFDRAFDVVTANAALPFFTPEELRQALSQLGSVVTPGGHLVVFDWVHPFDVGLEIVETSQAFPQGLRFFFRGERQMRELLDEAGFDEVTLRPFHIPIDLPRPEDPADLRTWTQRTADGTGLSFRGGLYQPWCHLVARKGS